MVKRSSSLWSDQRCGRTEDTKFSKLEVNITVTIVIRKYEGLMDNIGKVYKKFVKKKNMIPIPWNASDDGMRDVKDVGRANTNIDEVNMLRMNKITNSLPKVLG